jgi:predicted Rossmann fold nucleotide-binding protein DprA/Smf involved in DNA uptake
MNEKLTPMPMPIPLPAALRERLTALGIDAPAPFTCIGDATLLQEPLFAFIASRSCPGSALLQLVELVPQWVKAGKVIVSGFHAPIEQQAMSSTIRRKGRVVKVLARGMSAYKPSFEEREALEGKNMLILTALPPTIKRATRATALERNKLVLALANEHYIPWLSPDSPLWEMVNVNKQICIVYS